MDKYVTYLELLQMVKEGKQPEVVSFRGNKYTYMNGEYKREIDRRGGLVNTLATVFTELNLTRNAEIMYEENILTAAEKKYLRTVIAPFRERIRRVTKVNVNGVAEYIGMTLSSMILASKLDTINLPYFEAGTMYKGMSADHVYTIEDLKL